MSTDDEDTSPARPSAMPGRATHADRRDSKHYRDDGTCPFGSDSIDRRIMVPYIVSGLEALSDADLLRILDIVGRT